MISERELSFLLYEFLDTEALLDRPRYRDHARSTFDATLATGRLIALELFAPHNGLADRDPPSFVDNEVIPRPETAAAWRALADAGFLNCHWDEEEGGLQMPEVIARAALACFFSANAGTSAYPFLTIGAANLLRAFGSDGLKRRYMAGLGDGRIAGTMALTEPGQGSALGDLKTKAVDAGDGTYRLFGQKIFITGGDQNFTGNIVHMVLARIVGAPPGAKGISLFLAPKFVAADDGAPGPRNDIAVAGLLHKMGWRNAASTVLSFGAADGAVAYLLGEPHRGLSHMFQMMNEARIGVGLSAASLAYSGFARSLDYARQRPQGRLPSAKDPLSPQIMLVGHADVRRLLIAQKSYAEGALALCLYSCSLFEDHRTHPEPEARGASLLLLDLLTPVVKSWSAKYGCAANDMAIQVLGGAGYTADYPLEQLYRDQRLNPIHEGAEAIHGLDLLGRKVAMQEGAAFTLFCQSVGRDIAGAHPALRKDAGLLAKALKQLEQVTRLLMPVLREDPDLALANATLYLDAFGIVTVAWMWLKQANRAVRSLDSSPDGSQDYYRGKLQTARYFLTYELPAFSRYAALLQSLDRIPLDMKDAWFA